MEIFTVIESADGEVLQVLTFQSYTPALARFDRICAECDYMLGYVDHSTSTVGCIRSAGSHEDNCHVFLYRTILDES